MRYFIDAMFSYLGFHTPHDPAQPKQERWLPEGLHDSREIDKEQA